MNKIIIDNNNMYELISGSQYREETIKISDPHIKNNLYLEIEKKAQNPLETETYYYKKINEKQLDLIFKTKLFNEIENQNELQRINNQYLKNLESINTKLTFFVILTIISIIASIILALR